MGWRRRAFASPCAKLASVSNHHYRGNFRRSLESGRPRDGQTTASDREHGQPRRRIVTSRSRCVFEDARGTSQFGDADELLVAASLDAAELDFGRDLILSNSRTASGASPTGGAAFLTSGHRA